MWLGLFNFTATLEDNTKPLKEGMIGSAEIHWPYKAHAVGFEDSWVAGPNKAINFTS